MNELEIMQVGEGKYVAIVSVGTVSSGICDSRFDAALELVESIRGIASDLADQAVGTEAAGEAR
jgi:hypothetical protein